MTDFARDTIDDVDLAKYDRLGEDWWDTNGPMRALHKFNPVRVGWIRDLLTRETTKGDATRTEMPLRGFRVLDIGCGGGILSESLARLGATMVGIDPAPNNIAVADRHAQSGGLTISYACTTAEALAPKGDAFDAVLAMEVIEHVRDVNTFVHNAAAMVKPGGLMIGATLNRTLTSYALAIVGAEYVLRWLPRGTHDWHKFVTPTEFKGLMARHSLAAITETGVTFDPLRNSWRLSRDMSCNYMVAAQRPAGGDFRCHGRGMAAA